MENHITIITETFMIKKLKSSYLILIFLMVLTSCVSNPYNEIIIATKDTAMYDTNYYNQLIINDEQNYLFKTVDYFSNNYPYSAKQLEEFFNVKFYISKKNINDETIIESESKHSYFKDISLTDGLPYGQLLFLNIEKPICFNRIKFLEKMMTDEYTLVPLLPVPSYASIMDKMNNKGTIHISYILINDRKDICVTELIFNTYELFDSSLYSN